MKRSLLTGLVGLTVFIGATTGVFAGTHNVQISPNSSDSKSIAKTLQVYLDAFSTNNLPKAYSMFADIERHISLKQFEAQGDPQRGWSSVLTVVHVAEEHNEALVYTVSRVSPPKENGSHNFIFVFPMVKKNGAWKLVKDERDFGHHKYLIFQKLNKAVDAYIAKHHVILN